MAGAEQCSSMPEPDDSPLLQLPSDLLEHVWQHLREHRGNPFQDSRHQHALRMACKALRDITNGWISSHAIVLDCSAAAADDAGYPVTSALMEQLMRFPSLCELCRTMHACIPFMHAHGNHFATDRTQAP
jgi:hypothetical protein